MVRIEIILFILLVGTAFFWRFANYDQRWTLNQDQARDAIIALESIEQHKLPLLGPPSSAGAFSFGPIYYWFIIFSTLITQPIIFGPWICFTLLSVVSVVLFYFLGRALYGKTFGFILGSIAAFAPLDVTNAPDMLNPMPVGFLTVFAFFASVYLLQKKNLIYGSLLGLSIGLAINFHLQSLGLLTLIPLSILMLEADKKKKILLSLVTICGFIIAFLPLLYFDILNKGAWLNSVFQYLTAGQNKFSSPTSLLDEFRSFWPNLWGETILNRPDFGFVLIGLFIISVFLYRKKLIVSKSFLVILISFLIQALSLHYYKGPRMTVYLIVYHPYLIFFSAWSIWVIWKMQKYIGGILLFILISIAAFSDWKIVQFPTSQIPQVLELKNNLENTQKGPFEVSSYDSSFTISLPVFYLLKKEGKISQNGTKVGICNHFIIRTTDLKSYTTNCPDEKGLSEVGNFRIYKNPQGELFKITPEKIYNWIYDNYKP